MKLFKSTSKEEKRPLHLFGIYSWPQYKDILDISSKTILVFSEGNEDVAKAFMKEIGYQARMTFLNKEEKSEYMFFSYIQQALLHPYRERDLLIRLKKAISVSIACNISGLTKEVKEFLQEAGIKPIFVKIDKEKGSISIDDN